jgi:hypothetical protein
MTYFSKLSAIVAMSAAAVSPLAVSAATSVTQLNAHTVEVAFDSGNTMLVDFYSPDIVRLFMDPAGGIMRDPQANPPAKILVDNPRTKVDGLTINTNGPDGTIIVQAKGSDTKLTIKKSAETFTLTRGSSKADFNAPIAFAGGKTTVELAAQPNEYFYGGGVQNGRFSHRGKTIDIVNTNSWTDGGVASPAPFYWSTGGYGVLWNTFAPGAYDFGATKEGEVSLTHETPYLDIFVMLGEKGDISMLQPYYQLTGRPALLPKFGLYEGHLNAYNRDYWLETTDKDRGVLFEDGKYYRESQTDNGGIHESLNGELPGNYQFSARAVVDRYAAHDLPLGWILPNDGYGAGYGQTSSLSGNVKNLREFGEYARNHGVEIGLWTQSDLHPKEGIEPLLQRDIVAEVRDAGVRVLKTDVAWVGAGYSFGLNGVADVGQIMPYYGNEARPFTITLDGWAGTQRYAGVWTGDQTGGEWEYIRFHVPTYIGSGLSGMPYIGSDMDGIFGGKNLAVNVRDYQWKTFTPLQLNMDGWGSNPKYPHALGKQAETFNRAYLKLKSELMPYAYQVAHEAVVGEPMIRAMFIDYPNDYTLGSATKYQYMYGPSLLIAPIYQATAADAEGNDLRNGIYLPEGTWFDYFTGQAYTGGVVLNNFDAPLWKLPVFVKADAIIPMANPNNNPNQIDRTQRIIEFWPQANGAYTDYDDDGTTQAYLYGSYATTDIKSTVDAKKKALTINIAPTQGTFDGFQPMKTTELRVNVSAEPKQVAVKVGGKSVSLTKVSSLAEFNASSGNVWWVNETANRLSQWGVEEAPSCGLQVWVKVAKTDISANGIELAVKGFEFTPSAPAMTAITAPAAPVVALADDAVQPYSLNVAWQPQADAASVEIEHNGMLYTNCGTSEGNHSLLFEDLQPQTSYNFRLRAVNPAGASDWTDLQLTTANNPLEFAVHVAHAECSAADQDGFNIDRLFDFEERGDIWHTDYSGGAVPFTVTMDLGSFNRLDRFDYLPRLDAGNGTLLHGTVAVSENGKDWTEAGEFTWKRNSDTKSFKFDGNPLARYIRLSVDQATGNFGSGRELYVFKVPGSSSYIPGDINNDGKIDENDLTSYTNYTGLRRGDGDFDYVSMGDVNRNGLIDAFDISNVATRLGHGISPYDESAKISGSIAVTANKRSYAAGEEVILTVKGKDLTGLNAMSFALPYDATHFEYVGIEAAALSGMENLTYDRLHTAGDKVLYPTFVNIGDKPVVEGSETLCTIKFRARRAGAFTVAPASVVLVDKHLNQL